jgi:hypothetical protein
MKTGRDIQLLAAEVLRQNETKRDLIASTKAMDITMADGRVALQVGDKGTFPIGDIAHGQIASLTKVPRDYYQRMQGEAPDLLANNIKTWFDKYPVPRLVRTLDGNARAMLSDKYPVTFDNYDFANAVLPILHDRKLEVLSCEITERKLYLKAVDQQLFRDVPVGRKYGDGSHTIFDTCAPVIILANSEVGFGNLLCETGVYTKGCTNLSLWAAGGMKRRHVGARHHLAEGMDVGDLDEVLSSSTKRKTAEALWAQVSDIIAAAFDTKMLDKRLETLAATAENKIVGDVNKVVELTAERFGLNEGEKTSVLNHLAAGGLLTQYGLHAAITRTAADVESYDRATELEYLGGKVIELPRAEWQTLAEAA